ncbi:50S ribosomal protein L24 [Psittacicella melopsittaci]|uniref:Large ribosomal subunit protein uL24 n=1 Tax=Psittacicella melopsittaci TaxID=2028576 RepID=A0A3A1Y6V7_9GAMM|nr:50S ribosomal protein L24 [Psittacicella melopsittaci]RIY33020.1 50S ribosomal protein L24 [Psittacicella melopsittaci]
MANKIRSNDEVVLVVGSEKAGKGQRGRVSKVLPNGKLIVTGLNLVTKHERPNPQLGIEGGRTTKEAPIDASNVAIWNPATQKADRVGFRFEDGKKVRYFKSTGETIK